MTSTAHHCNWRCYPGYHIEPYGRENTMPDLGMIAYEAYGAVTGGKNFQGDPMPAWEDLPSLIRQAWDAASQAVLKA